MNYKSVFKMTGRMIGVEGILLLLSALVALLYREFPAFFSLLIGAALAIILFLCSLFFKSEDRIIAKEGFLTVALSWILMSLIGALPFTVSGEIPSYIDAVFETVSGLTTTGATILTDVEKLSHGILFWRSLTHWIGGMGIIVLVLALLPSGSGRSMYMARAEMPGPSVSKLVPKLKDTAIILYAIYVALTFLEILFLVFGGMNLFESAVHAFGTAGTGGFGVHNDSIASYSPYIQWVITAFMLLFAVNFNLYFFLLLRSFSAAFKNEELWLFGGIVIVAATAITINIYPLYHSVSDAIRNGLFQVASIISTTGYTTANIDQWPNLSKGILFALMFIGGCAGSTAGGMKVSRLLLMLKMIKNSFVRMLHPHSVKAVTVDGKAVDSETLNGVSVYFMLYMLCMVILFLLLSFEKFDLTSNLTATVTTFNNVGPAYGAGASGFACYSVFSKIAMSLAMLLGRLEIYPILICFSPSMWVKK